MPMLMSGGLQLQQIVLQGGNPAIYDSNGLSDNLLRNRKHLSGILVVEDELGCDIRGLAGKKQLFSLLNQESVSAFKEGWRHPACRAMISCLAANRTGAAADAVIHTLPTDPAHSAMEIA
mmetsp:Transcript_7353/g.20929  ORF Transcript_7353/g.20929 Transcript_7353/m.20929 type:complete len:120 (+) Transcript_7353:164-523(+)|eukprot:CAMPEP_0119120764 /NCGR_PEP_ID=MMETSP1310-20130426/1674_1 /TAXON_ID=464262 /ORGANISM="Genus nov. species nov., Strain RCC2339" /LENGTH=119 /DNA_ID=CAMNT_0007110269 /DNA_START=150 /DNA_END=509 /DNA_ORIENTATION=+